MARLLVVMLVGVACALCVRQAVPTSAAGIAGISAGYFHTCALSTSGDVRCWGQNQAGQLGNGTTTDSPTPVSVTGLSSVVVASVSAGLDRTCVLTTGNAIKCWGRNTYGELGNGTTSDSPAPVNVTGLSSGAVAVSTGGYHTCALTTAGGVKCWGDNADGDLGNGSTGNSSTPVDVVGLSSGVATVSAGYLHTCALTTAGGVKCWGDNFYGELGDATTVNSATPVDVSGLTSGVVAIAAGDGSTCAVLAGGHAKCWGSNDNNQLGNASSSGPQTCSGLPCSPVPVDVSGLTSGVADISAGALPTCALMTAGGVKCWGINNDGELGDGTTAESNIPVDVTGFATGVGHISDGYQHACALTMAGGVKCWGNNRHGQLGNGSSSGPQSCSGFPCSTVPVDVLQVKSVGGLTELPDIGGQQMTIQSSQARTVTYWPWMLGVSIVASSAIGLAVWRRKKHSSKGAGQLA